MNYQELEKLFPFKHRYITVGQNRIHYIDEGAGNVLLMFHACPMWSFAYRRQIQEFAADHRVIAFDMLGFGLSDKPYDFDYTLTGHINLVESLIAALELKNITLVMLGRHDRNGIRGPAPEPGHGSGHSQFNGVFRFPASVASLPLPRSVARLQDHSRPENASVRSQ